LLRQQGGQGGGSMTRRVVAILPARLGSTRFAGKLLHPHLGKPLLYHVWNQVRSSRLIDRVAVATDSHLIAEAAESFGADVIMTSTSHHTGTDRVAEAAQKTGGQIVLNVQSDNYGLKPAVLDRVIKRMLSDRGLHYATLARPICDDSELFDPNLVKVVTDDRGVALWFSRYPLPFIQKPALDPRWRQYRFLGHIGVYFFRRTALEAFAAWPRSPLEKAESLEQLRVLANGGRMQVFRTAVRSVSVDSPQDLEKISKVDR